MEELMKVSRTQYRVSDFLSWQRKGNLDLRPPFQRGNVWSEKAKSYFIDSLVRGFPVPLLFLQDQTDPKTYEPKRLVVDGQQRLRTVIAFIDRKCLSDAEEEDDFTVLRIHNPEIAGAKFDDLAASIQQRILDFEFSVQVLPSTTPNRLLLETFARMNATGVRLNDQEIRNAEFSGAFKQVAYDLGYQELERWLRWKVFTKAQIARMKEVELTSDLIVFLLSGLGAKSQAGITARYREFDDEFPHEAVMRRRFSRVLDKLDEIYSDDLNELFNEEFKDTPFNTQGWFYPLFVLVHDLAYRSPALAAPSERPRPVDAQELRHHLQGRSTDLVESLQAKELDPDLLKALRGAATDKASRQRRYEFLKEELAGAS